MRAFARLFLTLFVLIGTFTIAWARPAAAQETQPEDLPIGRYVADVRFSFPKFKQDPNVASSIGVATENLPTRGLGMAVGAHWYPLRLGIVTLGIGGELSKATRGRTTDTGTETAPAQVAVNTRFSAVSPQISFNFGARDGWSYISGGIGWSTFTTENVDHPLPDPESSTKTINYGGGARWFAKKHLAFNFDVRFYAVNPQLATATRPGFPRMTLVALCGGISIR
jgi:Outer membrane protein beta-barrel domain